MTARAPRLGPEARAALETVRAEAGQPVWLVGGALRDAALNRPVADLDLACADARPLAKRLARAFDATLVVLDEENAVYRLALAPAPGRTLVQLDVAGLQGKSIEEDLRRRDFTINALALPLDGSTRLLDPRGGLADLKARLVRAEIESNLDDDPLRLLRAFRIAAQLGFSVEKRTLKAVAARAERAAEPAPERIAAELLAALAVPGASGVLRSLDAAGLLTVLFPELAPSRTCAEDYYGRGGVLKHTLEVCARLDFLLSNLKTVYPALRGDLEAYVARRGGAHFRGLLLLAALLHDVSKPETAKVVDGRLRFFKHDELGAARSESILRRLRLSRAQIDAACAVVRHHLRPGHLAAGGAVTERALYRFFRDLGDDAAALLLVAWADHASYLDEAGLKRRLKLAVGAADLARVKPEEARKTLRHLQLVSRLLRRWRDLSRAPAPERLLDGKDVMKALKIPPGPKVGELLEKVREAQAAGEVSDRAGALALLSRLK